MAEIKEPETALKPFEKGGPSPNPGGRPKLIREFQKALEAKHYPKALHVLLDALDDDDGRVRVAACKEVFDRLFGKPTQRISGEDGGPVRVEVDLAAMIHRLSGRG